MGALMKKSKNEWGIAHLGIILAAVLIVVIGFVGWRVMNSAKEDKTANSAQNSSPVPTPAEKKTESAPEIMWQFNDTAWTPSSTPPACPNPLKLTTPVDLSKATSILYPGQTRGQYKPHGGFAVDNAANNMVTVKIPMDAKMVSGSRYIEDGEQQILLIFTAPCGISYRFDHLYTLTEKFQKAVDATLPPAKVDDSRTTNFNPGVAVTAGEVLATEVGHKKTLNVGFDFGVYDLRQPNEISKNAAWAAAHASEKSNAYYGVCWFDMLPAADAAKVKSLPSRDSKSGKSSDYCK